ncbi:MAG: tetratricopeptide repeat protein [Candidatus Zixiibacteriota bacterium]
MDNGTPLARRTLYLLIVTAALFAAGRFLGGSLFDNNWSFTQWRAFSWWYGVVWLLLCAAGLHAAYHHHERLQNLIVKRLFAPVALAILTIAAILLSFDSFVYGGGNLRIGQIGQVNTAVFHWYELGTTAIVALLFQATSLFSSKPHIAAWWAWRLFSFLCAGLTIWGAIRLSAALAQGKAECVWLTMILLFGGHTLVLLGYTGIEPVLVASVIWFAALALPALQSRRGRHVMILWGLTALAVVMHAANLYLIPAVVYVSIAGTGKQSRQARTAIAASALLLCALIATTYWYADRSFSFSDQILFLHGKSPFNDYSLFSLRHLGDFTQLLFLASPLLVLIAGLTLRQHAMDPRMRLSAVGWILLLGGSVTAFVINPINGIPLDFPRLAAFLCPVALLVACIVAAQGGRTAAMVAVFALMAPLSYLPVYIRIDHAGPYVTEYLDKHDALYRTACLSFRDAYFARREFSSADQWEWKLPVKSPEVLNLRGISSLSMSGDNEEALRVLYPLIAKNPYWDEPRALAAQIQMKLQRFNLAKPQIDTCLMLAPDKKEHLTLLYQYLRDNQRYPEALAQVERAKQLYPHDMDVAIDYVIAKYRIADYVGAESAADSLLAADSTTAYAHLIKGLLYERNGDVVRAVRHYDSFVTLAPEEPEAATIRQRLNVLRERVPSGR